MTTLRGQTKIEVERPEGIVIIQAPIREFQVQADESVLPETITLTSFVQNIDNPYYKWSYFNGVSWVDTIYNTKSIVVEWGSWNKRQFKLEVIGHVTDSLEEISGQMGVSIVEINKVPYSGSVQEGITMIKALSDTLSYDQAGLIVKALMLLHGERTSTITAGLSGLQGDGYQPAYFSGGTLEEAINFGIVYKAITDGAVIPNLKMANRVDLHNGAAKIGHLMFHPNGSAFFLNENNVVSFVLNSLTIPSLYELMNDNNVPFTVSNTAYIKGAETFVLPNKITLPKSNSSLKIEANISFRFLGVESHGQNIGFMSYGSYLYLYKNGEEHSFISNIDIGNDDSDYNGETLYKNINKTFYNIPSAEYSLVLKFVSFVEGNPPIPFTFDVEVGVSESVLTGYYNPFANDMVQIGGDGLAIKFGTNIFHVNPEGIKARGNVDLGLPEAKDYISGIVGPNGLLIFGISGVSSSKISTGKYKIEHYLQTQSYQIILSGSSPENNYTYTSRGLNYFHVEVTKNNGVTYVDSEFDFLIVH